MKIVEATMVMPMACVIAISLIGLMMVFYDQLLVQTAENKEELAQIYQSREVTYIRTYDRMEHGFAE